MKHSSMEFAAVLTRILISVSIITAVICQQEEGEIPRFVTRSQTHRIIVGDTAILPCRVDRLGDYVLLWKRGAAVLSAGDMKITRDSRFDLVDGFNLEIKKVKPVDGGDYICQISTLAPDEQIHTLEILVPPTVKIDPPNHLSITKSEKVTIHCRGSGNPVPKITWTRKNNLLPNGEQSSDGYSFTIVKADRHSAGTYLCTADNGVGTPATTSIDVKVLYPPEIELEQSRVHSGEGREAVLVCIVHADPPTSQVRWFRDTMVLDPDGQRLMEIRGSRQSLIIRNVQAADFGNYSCEADNKLGRSMKYIELSGKPNQPVFRSDPSGRQLGSFNISWTVESFSFVDEYRLSYRKKHTNESYETPGQWHDVVIPTTDTSKSKAALKSVIHWKSYYIRNLDPGVLYEAKVVARNKYGWGFASDLFQFDTRSADHYYPFESSPQHDVLSEPEVRDMRIISPSSASSFIPGIQQVLITAVLSCYLILNGCKGNRIRFV